VLFDLWQGDPTIHPDQAAGYAACEAATDAPPAEGSVGAGAGATVGKLFGPELAMKGGIGSASLKVGGVTVAALVAVNAVGDVIGEDGTVLAGARGPDGRLIGIAQALREGRVPAALLTGMSTTLGIVATDARLTKAQAKKVAQMAHDGLARTINPVHTPFDGDVVFSLATGGSGLPGNVALIGALAAEVMAQAVLRGARASNP
uniref:P1 family peptidase n=1 Tax=Pelomonas sp. KK5 TaxID=1855730 RepID=UPI0018EA2AE8